MTVLEKMDVTKKTTIKYILPIYPSQPAWPGPGAAAAPAPRRGPGATGSLPGSETRTVRQVRWSRVDSARGGQASE
jgi:hypothetical protein